MIATNLHHLPRVRLHAEALAPARAGFRALIPLINIIQIRVRTPTVSFLVYPLQMGIACAGWRPLDTSPALPPIAGFPALTPSPRLDLSQPTIRAN